MSERQSPDQPCALYPLERPDCSLGNPATCKSPKASEAKKVVGGRLLFPLPCSSGSNPIEAAFSKLEGLLRSDVARNCDELWKAIGHFGCLFTGVKCCSFFTAAGCEFK